MKQTSKSFQLGEVVLERGRGVTLQLREKKVFISFPTRTDQAFLWLDFVPP